MSISQLLLGFLLSTSVSYLAWRLKTLATGGAWAAMLVGGLLFGLGGWRWALVLLAFFISSSALSSLFHQYKIHLDKKIVKGHRRDAVQVLANGSVGTALVIASVLWPEYLVFWLAYAGAMATATADTWATEIGVCSRTSPRLITTGQPIESGISGGVTILGLLATGLGALFIAGIAGLLTPSIPFITTVIIVASAGTIGALFDSLLGATIQAVYHCPRCATQTEHYPQHHCSQTTVLKRGWHAINNDSVNFISIGLGAVVAAGLWQLLSRYLA